MKKIIHIDIDAFYASVEQRDDVSLRGKPVAVGYSEKRGVVAAASYEARKFGVHSAMPSVTAKRKCPHLIFRLPRFNVYRDISRQIMDIYFEYTDLVEPLSLDEAFLDITVNYKNMPSATIMAKEIQQRIFRETGLTVSAGVSYNKFLAKIASDYKKPNGFFAIVPEEAERFIEQLAIERFYGVGKVTAAKMRELQIFNGYDLKQWSLIDLVKIFGKSGNVFYNYARGVDLREVVPDRIIKSVSSENTFDKDISILPSLNVELYHIAREVMRRVDQSSFHGRTITLKVKYADFKVITRSKTINGHIPDFEALWMISKDMLKNIDLSQRGVRLLGLGVSNGDTINEKIYTQLEFDFPE
ncbi:MAG: DNA polymerase IV [Bacteroidales bacterium]|nr:DNA polymerase IV [Bacteroidales bacterium]